MLKVRGVLIWLLIASPLFLLSQISGGSVNVYKGIGYSNCEVLEGYLTRTDVLGPGKGISSDGDLSGFQGFLFLGDKYLVGAGGYSMKMGTDFFTKGSVTKTSAGWMINTGFFLSRKDDDYQFLYLGVGSGKLNINIKATGTRVKFDQFSPLYENSSQKYSLEGICYEFGYSYREVITSFTIFEKEKDFLLGIDGGVNYIIAAKGWKNVEMGPPVFHPFYFFLRISVGLGFTKPYVVSSSKV